MEIYIDGEYVFIIFYVRDMFLCDVCNILEGLYSNAAENLNIKALLQLHFLYPHTKF